jgi:hypothetical protein
MSDKTPLERDIERHERFKVPASMYIIVILLLLCIAAVGFYTFNLQKALVQKDSEIDLIKEDFIKEKKRLVDKIKQLEKSASKQPSR